MCAWFYFAIVLESWYLIFYFVSFSNRIIKLAISGAEKATLVLGVAKYRLCRGLHQEAASALEALLTSSVGADLDPDARLNALASLVKA